MLRPKRCITAGLDTPCQVPPRVVTCTDGIMIQSQVRLDTSLMSLCVDSDTACLGVGALASWPHYLDLGFTSEKVGKETR